jgi:hypothetical protein
MAQVSVPITIYTSVGVAEADPDGVIAWMRVADLQPVVENALAAARVNAPKVGYHSQRCRHCDHLRAAHALTASGCLGHALPGRPRAECPCSEFIEVTP